MDREELAWAAGFFDGEGHSSASRYRNTAYHYLIMALSQVEKIPFERFVKAVGVGRTYLYPNTHGNHPINIWRASNKEALQAMELLRSFLSQPKIDQFNQALATVRSYPGWGVGTGHHHSKKRNGV